MDNKKDRMEYLSEYKEGIRLVSINELGDDRIPNQWYEIFKEGDQQKRIDKVLSLWIQYCGLNLRNTISYLSNNLRDVELYEYDDALIVLYQLVMENGEIDYYEGKLPYKPLEGREQAGINAVWDRTPQSIRDFYEYIHNGFYYFASGYMGLVSLEEVTCLEELDWGILDGLDEPLQINLETSYYFFSSGMGGYVVIDYDNEVNGNATIWFAKKQPMYNRDFWDFVDEWIVMGFQ